MKTKCACRSTDAHECWMIRYGMRPMASTGDVERDGGPCQCACHDEDDFEGSPHDFIHR